jgi:hypothetical protein
MVNGRSGRVPVVVDTPVKVDAATDVPVSGQVATTQRHRGHLLVSPLRSSKPAGSTAALSVSRTRFGRAVVQASSNLSDGW